MIELISPNKKQYRANLHCHSTLSDGKKTPQELKEMYKSHGYDVLAITDHERPAQHQDMSDKDFIMLTGYECYIRQDPHGKYNAFEKEIHLNLFAKDPMNVKMICFNEDYCSYLKRDNAISQLERVGSERPREYSVSYVNEYIRTAKDNGYIVAYNHPFWSMESEADILDYEGFFSMEMCNYSSWVQNHLEYNAALYDKMLKMGKRVFCHGSDDNHNKYPTDSILSDSFGAFTMIIPDEFTYSGVIDAMERGNMYASTGPLFHRVCVDGDTVHIECSDVSHAFLYVGSRSPKHIYAEKGTSLNSFDFEINENVRYLRVSIQDSEGRFADTRGFFPDEFR
ncbi:MAG: PHP domain-containing protein [Clostridia bacterium]|nr:PHP domain-containing protein [Clostridia bacterium]